MDANIHPDLHQLHQRYLQLVQAVNDQTMSIDDAVASLEAMRVIDGSGSEWSYTTAGQLVRAEQPGGEQIPSEPWAFVAAQLPPRAAENQWQAPFPTGGATPQPGYPQQGAWQGQPPTGSHQAPGGRALPGGTQGRKLNIPGIDPVLDIVKANGKTIIVAVLVAAVVFAITGRGGTPDPAPTVADSIPVVPAPGPPAGTALPNVDSSPENVTAPEDVVEPEPELLVPTGDDVLAALTALRSGDVRLLAAAVVTVGDETGMRLLAAQLAGLENVALGLKADPAAPDGDGVAVQNWLLVDAVTGETLRTYPMTWLKQESGQWLLKEAPDLG